MQLPNNLKIILLVGAAILILALAYYVSYERGKRASLSLVSSQPRVQTPSPMPSISSTPTPITTPVVDTSDWKNYRNEEYGFEFKYPGNLKSKTEFEGDYSFGENLWSMEDYLDNNPGGTPIINIPLYEIHQADYFVMELRIGVNSTPEKVANCLKFDCSDYGKDCLSKKSINGIDFTILPIDGLGGAGHYVDGYSYRTIHENSCFAIEQIIFGSGSQGDIDPAQIQDYRDKGTDTINEILSTFKFIGSTPTSKLSN